MKKAGYWLIAGFFVLNLCGCSGEAAVSSSDSMASDLKAGKEASKGEPTAQPKSRMIKVDPAKANEAVPGGSSQSPQ